MKNKVIIYCILLSLTLNLFAFSTYANGNYFTDSCDNLDKIFEKSDNINILNTGANASYFENKNNIFQRTTGNEEGFISYKIAGNCQAKIVSYHYPNSDSNFNFYENGKKITPNIKTTKNAKTWDKIVYTFPLNGKNSVLKIEFPKTSGNGWVNTISEVTTRESVYQNAAEKINDSVLSEYENQINTVVALGFMNAENSEFNPFSQVTYEDLAGVLEKTFALPTGGAVSSGLIAKSDNKRATIEDAIKSVALGLGYGKAGAENLTSTAMEIGLLKNMGKINIDDILTKEILSAVIFNALEKDMMVQTSFGVHPRYEIKSGYNILNICHKISTSYGILEKSNDIKIKSGLTEENVLSIDGKYFNTENNYDDLLGHCVKYYAKYHKSSDEKTVIYMCKVGKSTEENVDLDAVTSYNGNAIFVNKEKYSFARDGKVLNNSEYIGDFSLGNITADNIFPKNIDGNLCLIDNNGDGDFDVIKLETFTTFEITNISKDSKTLVDSKTKKTYNLEDAKIVIIDENGDYLSFDDLSNNIAIDLCLSKNAKFAKMRILSPAIEGEVTQISDDDIAVGDANYGISNTLKNNIASNIENKIRAGETYSIILNGQNKVAIVKSTQSKKINYGFLAGISQNGFNYKGKLFTDNGIMGIYTISAKAKINGINYANISKSELYKNGEFAPQMVKIKMFNNEITFIETSKKSSENAVTDDFTLNFENTSIGYRGGNYSSFASRYTLSDNCKIFVVPFDKSKDSDYKIADKNYFIVDKLYDIKLFNVDTNYKAGVILVSLPDPGVKSVLQAKSHIPRMMFEKSTTIMVNDEEKCKIYGYVDGEKVSYIASINELMGYANWPTNTDATVSIGSLKPGDLIQFTTNEKGEFSIFSLLFSYNKSTYKPFEKSNGVSVGISINEAYDDIYLAGGKIRNIYEDRIIFDTIYNDNSVIRNLSLSGANVYKLKKSTNELVKYDVSELKIGDSIFVQNVYHLTQNILIIE